MVGDDLIRATAPGARAAGRDRAPRRIMYVLNDLALGGAQRVVLNQASRLDRATFAPEVASLELDPSGELARDFESAGIPIYRLRRPNELPSAGWPRLHDLLRRLRPDLVHTHLAAAGIAGRVSARRCGVPRILTTLHNLSDWEEKRLSPLRWLDRRTLPLAHAVVTVSDAVREAFARTIPRLAERVVTVRNGVPLDLFLGARQERTSVRTMLGYAPDDFVVGSVARLDPRKGLDTLIEAFALAAPQAPKMRLLLIGDGPQRSRLEALARSRGVYDRMILVRHQTRVRGHLAAMDLFAAPSRTEGLGMAIIEALAAGVPVLGSHVGGIPEVVVDGECGRLLPPHDTTVWARTILHLASRPQELGAWAAAGPRRASRFSVEASARALEGIYARLLGVEPQQEVIEEAA